MESLPGYDAWKLAEPPMPRDDVPKEHRVTIELTWRAYVPPADAGNVAEWTAKRLAAALRDIPDTALVEVVGFRIMDVWQTEEDE